MIEPLAPGPYQNELGDWWVPTTTPYLEARRLVKGCLDDPLMSIGYIGRETVRLDPCCEFGDDACQNAQTVPAWHFVEYER